MKRREDWPVIARRAEGLLKPVEWSTRLRRERGFLVDLVLPEDDE